MTLILGIAALVLVMLHVFDRCALWVPVLVLCLIPILASIVGYMNHA